MDSEGGVSGKRGRSPWMVGMSQWIVGESVDSET